MFNTILSVDIFFFSHITFFLFSCAFCYDILKFDHYYDPIIIIINLLSRCMLIIRKQVFKFRRQLIDQ